MEQNGCPENRYQVNLAKPKKIPLVIPPCPDIQPCLVKI